MGRLGPHYGGALPAAFLTSCLQLRNYAEECSVFILTVKLSLKYCISVTSLCAQTGKSRVYLQDAHADFWYQVRVAAVTPDGHSDFSHSAPVLVAAASDSDAQSIGVLLCAVLFCLNLRIHFESLNLIPIASTVHSSSKCRIRAASDATELRARDGARRVSSRNDLLVVAHFFRRQPTDRWLSSTCKQICGKTK